MEDKKNLANENEAIETPETIAPEKSEIEIMGEKLAEMNDKYIRCVAELENTRRRSMLDAENAIRNRAISVSKNFLTVMDAIESALSHAPEDAGILAMKAAMDSAFANIGITKIESVGEILNPALHNAIQMIESDKPTNTITTQLQTGYMFGDSVLRPAMVVVAK